MVQVFRKTVELGGIAIAAHIERLPTGFLEANESHEVESGDSRQRRPQRPRNNRCRRTRGSGTKGWSRVTGAR